jgi:predicted TIM-barrel fold metal-dependent hydrolase
MVIVDAGQYLIEPPDFWTSRLPTTLQEQAPRVVASGEGEEAWSFEGDAWIRPLTFGTSVKRPSREGRPLTESYATMRAGCYDPSARVRDMDLDGIDAAVLFPHFGMALGRIRDPELYVAYVRAYNDGAWEWAQQANPRRVFPVALIPAQGLEESVEELSRVLRLGYKGVLFCGWPNGSREPRPEDGRFWGLCNESGVVVNFHGPEPERQPAIPGSWGTGQVAGESPLELVINARASGLGAQMPIGRLILRGVLDEFPALKLCFAGTGASWLPFFMEQVDGMYWHDRFYAGFDFKMLPSEYVKRNTKATFHIDSAALSNLNDIGAANLLWQSLYPLETSDWPRSRDLIDKTFADLAASDRSRILADNTADYYGIALRAGAIA